MPYYVGLTHDNKRQLLNSVSVPTEQSFDGRYAAIIGPFRTKRGALYMQKHGGNNPHLQCVSDAEYIAKQR